MILLADIVEMLPLTERKNIEMHKNVAGASGGIANVSQSPSHGNRSELMPALRCRNSVMWSFVHERQLLPWERWCVQGMFPAWATWCDPVLRAPFQFACPLAAVERMAGNSMHLPTMGLCWLVGLSQYSLRGPVENVSDQKNMVRCVGFYDASLGALVSLCLFVLLGHGPSKRIENQ